MSVVPGASYVVDTNVARTANGDATHVDLECQIACVDALECVIECGIVVLDDGRLILDEYVNGLEGRIGTGTAFFKHVCTNAWVEDRVRRVPVDVDALPPNTLGKDQKFLAAAVSGCAEVLNATDSDWALNAAVTASLGVGVVQLCPRYAAKSDIGA